MCVIDFYTKLVETKRNDFTNALFEFVGESAGKVFE